MKFNKNEILNCGEFYKSLRKCKMNLESLNKSNNLYRHNRLIRDAPSYSKFKGIFTLLHRTKLMIDANVK